MDQETVYKHYWLTLYGSKVPYNIAYSSIKGKKSVVTPHDHDFAEIIWFTHGHGHHIINGEEFTVTKDHLIAILPGDIHEIYAHGQQVLSHYNLAIQAYVVDFYKEHYEQKDGNIFAKCEAGERVTILNSDQKQVLEESMAILYASPVEKVYLDRFMINLFCSLKSPMFSDAYHNLPDWLQVACKKIQEPEHFTQGVQALFNLAHRSKEHVARELKKVTGKTPTELINEVRLHYATRQLLATDRPIIDIALECGFNSLGHFYDCFKEMYGMAPRQYRIQNRKLVAH